MSAHQVNAEFYSLPEEVIAEMEAAKDKAAAAFWAYPGEGWQYEFEREWFLNHGYTEAANLAASCAAGE